MPVRPRARGSPQDAAGALVQSTRERQALRSGLAAGNRPRAPVDVTDIGEVVRGFCLRTVSWIQPRPKS